MMTAEYEDIPCPTCERLGWRKRRIVRVAAEDYDRLRKLIYDPAIHPAVSSRTWKGWEIGVAAVLMWLGLPAALYLAYTVAFFASFPGSVVAVELCFAPALWFMWWRDRPQLMRYLAETREREALYRKYGISASEPFTLRKEEVE